MGGVSVASRSSQQSVSGVSDLPPSGVSWTGKNSEEREEETVRKIFGTADDAHSGKMKSEKRIV